MKKISVILVLLSSLLFVYSSCKDENDNNNIDIYSSKEMEGTYIYKKDCDCEDLSFEDTMVGIAHVRNVTKNSFLIDRLGASYVYDYTMNKEGNMFYERNIAFNGSYWNPYRIKGKIIYVDSENPYLSDHYYILKGAYYTDTTFQDTVGLFCMKQVSHQTYGGYGYPDL